MLAEDQTETIRDRQWNRTFRTKTNLTLAWSYEDFSSSIFVNRLGSSSIEDADDYQRYPQWTTVNLRAGYNVTEDINVSLNVVNIFDKKPHQHISEKYWPFADLSKYSPVGMELFIEATVRF